jgi:chromosome segregation ATPase
MKAAVKSVLASVGLASAGQVNGALHQAQKAQAKLKALEDRLAKVREASANWKRRYEESVRAAAEFKQAASRADVKAERASAAAERAAAKADEWKARTDTLMGQVRDLSARLKEANRAATAAREHLMATEVKLDLIEAAIQVLDSRTRETAVTRS